MKFFDLMKFSLNNLSHRRMRSWLTLIGIFAGIAAVVALVSLGQGLQDAVNSQFSEVGVNRITLQGAGSSYGPPGTNAVGKLGDKDIRLIKETNGVEFAFGRYIKTTKYTHNDVDEIGFVVSMPEGDNTQKVIDTLGLDLSEGRWIGTGDNNKVLLGAGIEYNNEKPEIGSKMTIEGKKFTVVGILKKKGNPFFDDQIIIMEQAVKEIFDIKNDYSIVIVSVDINKDVGEVRDAIARKLRRDRGQSPGEEDFTISSPQESLEALNSILITIQILLVGIAAISLVVGAIGITNTMYTAVLERRKEIGIMKSIGAKNFDILKLFLFESGMLGLAGGILGLLVGIGISKSIEIGAFAYFGESIIKTTYPIWLIIGSLLFAFLLGAISGTLPARQASKMNPVDALRK